jgi:molecular chaperone GrpE
MTVKSDKADAKKEDKPVNEKDEIACLKTKLAEAENKSGEYLQMAQRLQADFDNYRKRTKRENEEYKVFATADLMSELLGIVDDLDRALEHADGKNDFVTGVKGIRQNLMKILESKGLKEIATDGKFDPNFHEALCVEEGDTDGNIAQVFQKGYRIGDKVLRYSKVKVTRKTEKTEDKSAAGE